MLHHCFTRPTKWTKTTNGLADMWASRSKPKKALDLHPTAGILPQSLFFFPSAAGTACSSLRRPAVLFSAPQ